jgi:hypothetical protein
MGVCKGRVGLPQFWDHPSNLETTKGMDTSAIAAAIIYIFISPSHASVCKLGSPRNKITISPINNLFIPVSVIPAVSMVLS